MLDYEEAQRRLLAGLEPLPVETVPLTAALGRTLSAPLVARLTQPPFPASAMDGYAVRWEDRNGPWRVVGESAAGHPHTGDVLPSDAVRIFTGAPVPAGADTVIVQEDVERAGDDLRLTGDGPPRSGAHIRPAGNDFDEGDELFPAKRTLGAVALGLAASAGHGELNVHARPKVALIATGDELVPPGITPGPAQIVSGNGPMLAAALSTWGADVQDFGIVEDRKDAIAAALRNAAAADIIVTIGGASVGDHDLVGVALKAADATLDFWKIAIKPGKPLIAGHLGDARIVGLPGNPVSAYICAVLFLRPMLYALTGRTDGADEVEAPLGVPLPANGPRRDHLRATVTDGVVYPLDVQDSGQLAALAHADALIIRPPGAEPKKAGESVPIIRLDRA